MVIEVLITLQGPPTPEKFERGIRSRNASYEVSSVLKVEFLSPVLPLLLSGLS